MGGVVPTDQTDGFTPGTIEGASHDVGPDGAFSYTIPIWVSPGRRRMQPDLALTYSSHSANGHAGIGWTLDGLSRITLGPSTVNHDGAERPVRYDGEDPFYLDGQRLVCIAGTHGQPGAEYRTQNDQFAKIILRATEYTVAGDQLGPEWFEAYLRDGRILRFGEYPGYADQATLTGKSATITGPTLPGQLSNTGDADVDLVLEGESALQNSTPSNRTLRYAWLLSRIQDRSGNYLEILHQDAARITGETTGVELLASELRYGGFLGGIAHNRRVMLDWEARPDARHQWVSGLKLGQSVRLKTIVAFGPDQTGQSIKLRQYDLAYRTDSVSQRSLLATVTESDQFGICKTPHQFTWELGTTTFTEIDLEFDDVKSVTSGRAILPGRLRTADFNGDGRDDLLLVRNSDLNQYYILPSDRTSPTLFGAPIPTGIVTPQSADGGRPYIVPAPDAAALDIISLVDNGQPGTPVPTYEAWRAGPAYAGGYQVAGTFAINKQPPIFDPTKVVLGIVEAVDLDGDGRVDLLLGDPAAPNQAVPLQQWFVRFNAGDNITFTTPEAPVGYFEADHYFVQLDGGLATTILVDSASLNPGAPPVLSGLTVTRNSLSGTAVATVPTTLITGQTYVFADLFGTGLPTAFSPGYSQATDPALLENVGGSFAMPQFLTLNLPNPPSDFTPIFRPMDWDQDGIQELLVRTRTTGQKDPIQILKWNGGAFDTTTLPFQSIIDAKSEFEIFEVIDANGNGLDDIVMYSDGGLRLFVRDGKRADMMTAVANGLGAFMEISYSPISDLGVHTPMGQYVYPQRNINAKIWCVNEVGEDDGLGGLRTTRYNYSGAVQDVTGEGFLGFAICNRTDLDTGETLELTYDLWPRSVGNTRCYPLRGVAVDSVRTTPLPNGRKQIQTIHRDMKIEPLNGAATYFVYAQGLSSEIHEQLNGVDVAPVRSSIESQACDAFGNVISYNLECGDGNQMGFVAQFDNDTVDWLIGLQATLTETSQAPAQPGAQRHRTFKYDNIGQMRLQVIEPLPATPNPQTVAPFYNLVTYDAYGNVVEVAWQTTLDRDPLARFVRFTYDLDDHAAIVRSTDTLGHAVTMTVDRGLQQLTSFTNENGFLTEFHFDGFARSRGVDLPDGSGVAFNYERLAYGLLARGTDKSGATQAFTFDALGRVTQNAKSMRADGKIVIVDTTYDKLGRVASVSLPHFDTDVGLLDTFTYDALGRILTTTSPDGSTTSTYRTGYWTTLTGAASEVSVKVDDLGRVIFVTDRDSALIGTPNAQGSTYVYAAFGRLASITDISGHVTTFGHDIRGRLTSLGAPDQAHRTFTYSPYSELASETQGTRTIIYDRDVLGRLKSISDGNAGTLRYFYDGPGALNRLVAAENTASGIVTRFRYSSVDKLEEKIWTIGGVDFTGYRKFDALGRVSVVGLPGTGAPHVEVTLKYGPRSQLIAAIGPGQKPVWQFDGADASGAFRREKLGNGLVDVTTEDPLHPGEIKTSETLRGATHLRFNDYQRDKISRVTGWDDQIHNLATTMRYDKFGRLADFRITAGSHHALSTFVYDDVGNLVHRVDAGTGSPSFTLTYGGAAGPHAVTGGTLGAYAYTDRGERKSAPGMSLTPGFGGLPAGIAATKGTNASLTMGYDASLDRIVTTDNATKEERIRLDNAYELRRPSTGIGGPAVEDETFLFSLGGRPICSWTRKNQGPLSEPTYFHVDRQGSLDLVTSENGLVIGAYRYDAFGDRRYAAHPSQQAKSPAQSLGLGFGGHSHVDNWGLIDMGGRWFDPATTRFLAPDRMVPHAYLPQSLNPYAFAMNDPINGFDPGGFDDNDDERHLVPVDAATQAAKDEHLRNHPYESRTRGKYVERADSQQNKKPAARRAEPARQPPPAPVVQRNDDGLLGSGPIGAPGKSARGAGTFHVYGNIAHVPSGMGLVQEHVSAWKTPLLVLGGGVAAGVTIGLGVEVLAGAEIVTSITEGISAARSWVGLRAIGLELHHVFPRALIALFAKYEFDIDELCVPIDRELHLLIHQEGYNDAWWEFFESYGAEMPTIDEVLNQASVLLEPYGYGEWGLLVLPYYGRVLVQDL